MILQSSGSKLPEIAQIAFHEKNEDNLRNLFLWFLKFDIWKTLKGNHSKNGNVKHFGFA